MKNLCQAKFNIKFRQNWPTKAWSLSLVFFIVFADCGGGGFFLAALRALVE
jgi:hypothetical protein